MSDITTEELEELRQLVKQAESKGEQSADWNGERLKACIIAGRRFAEIKIKLKGKWCRWVESNDIGISYRTAHNWLKIATAHAKSELNTATGIRKAYQLAGIYPDSDGSKATSAEPQELYMLHAIRLCSALNRLDFSGLNQVQREALRERLDMVAMLAKRLEVGA